MENEMTPNEKVIFLNDKNYWQTTDIAALTKALVTFNLDFNEKSLKADAKNTFLKNEYLTLDHILNTVRPLLAKNKLVVSQLLSGGDIVTSLYHESGQFIGSSVPNTPMDASKGTNKLQQIGGGLTYMRRYALCGLLNISIATDDDAQSFSLEKKPLPEGMYKMAYKAYVRDGKSFASVEKDYSLTDAVKKEILKNGKPVKTKQK